ncbi:MAG: hypothetical protein ACREL9_11775 [Gemmatimonadales bacterium]
MLKRTFAALAVLALVALPLAAQGAKQGQPGDEQTITGQVVDLNCYVSMGASGAGHKMCAEACAKAGVQLGILTSDGTLYMPVSAKPADPTNPRLQQYAEGKVKVTGVHRFANGMHTIEVKTIAAAS